MKQLNELMQQNQSIDDQPTSTYSYDPNKTAELYNSRPGESEGISCSKCLGKGTIMVVESDGYTAIKNCECVRSRTDKRMIERSGLASLSEVCTLERFETGNEWQQRMKTVTEAFIEDYAQHWFVLLGSTGAGKTHLAVATCNELMRRSQVTKYFTWREVTTNLKALMNTPEYLSMMHELKRIPVLYIDDFFKAAGNVKLPSASDIDIAMELLSARYNAKLTTIISSELLLDSILAIDEAIGSRIFEMTLGDRYLLQIEKTEGKNYRLQNY